MAKREPDVSSQLPSEQARKLAKRILTHGSVVFTRHARDEMENDDLLETDIANTIGAGLITEPGELGHQGDWCYRIRTNRICVVFLFRSPVELVVVTVWREKGRGR